MVRVLAAYPQVRLVFKDFPLETIHPWARAARPAAETRRRDREARGLVRGRQQPRRAKFARMRSAWTQLSLRLKTIPRTEENQPLSGFAAGAISAPMPF